MTPRYFYTELNTIAVSLGVESGLDLLEEIAYQALVHHRKQIEDILDLDLAEVKGLLEELREVGAVT